MVERVVTSMPPGPRTPPDYIGAETCAECFEPFNDGRIDRCIHRRKWGHDPVVLHPRPAAAEQHQENVEAARRYQEADRGR